MITHLPQDSWTQTALRDDPKHQAIRTASPKGPVRFGPWGLGNYQLADLIDAIRYDTWTKIAQRAHDAGQQPPPPPAPTPRPGAQPEAGALTPKGLAYLRRVHGQSSS